jgi:hypothetical protein
MRRLPIQVPKSANMRIVFSLSFILLCPALGLSQIVSFGFSVGIPLCHLAGATGTSTTTTSWYTIGPALRVGLPHAIGFDAEFLYRRFGFGSVSAQGGAAVHRVELPLLLRYAFPATALHPWLHAGLSFNRVLAVNGATLCSRGILGEEVYCIGDYRAAELRHRQTYGPVLGAGLDFGWGKMRLAPELRITRWVDRNFGTRDSSLRSNLTQVELLLGIVF